MNEALELGERVLKSIDDENMGNPYQRRNVIVDRWFDSLIEVTYELERRNKELYEK